MTRDTIDYELGPILLNLVQKAQIDNHITAEEAELINRIQIDVRDLERTMKEAMKTKAGKSPKEIFLTKRDEILANAKQTALTDGIITKDEQDILDELIEKLKMYE